MFGTQKVAPNVVWWGGVSPQPVKVKHKTSLFTSSRQTVGYEYYLTMQALLCWGPVDAILDILFNEKSLADGGYPVVLGYTLSGGFWNPNKVTVDYIEPKRSYPQVCQPDWC